MDRSVKEILKFEAVTSDGERRDIVDMLIDDHRWTVRYLVLDTGPHWLPGRRVLVSPHAFRNVRWSDRVISLGLSLEQIANAPPVSADMPVTLQNLRDLAQFHEWPPPDLEGAPLPDRVSAHLSPDTQALEDRQRSREELAEEGDSHLQSAEWLIGAKFALSDGEVAAIRDIEINGDDWSVTAFSGDARWRHEGPARIDASSVGKVNLRAGTVSLEMDKPSFQRLPASAPSGADADLSGRLR